MPHEGSRRRSVDAVVAALFALPPACTSTDAPKVALDVAPSEPSPPIADGPTELATTVHVRVRPHAIVLTTAVSTTLALQPWDDLAPLARALEQLALQLPMTPPVVLAIDPDVPGDWVLSVMGELARVNWGDTQFELSGGRRVPASLPSFCGCVADLPLSRCVHPVVDVQPSGIALGSFPARRGPCRSALLSAGWASEAAVDHSDVWPVDVQRLVIQDPSQCQDGRTPHHAIDPAELHTTLRRIDALAPGCPFATLRIGTDVAWSRIEPALGVLGDDLGWSVMLDMANHGALDCSATLLVSDLPAPPPAPGEWGRTTGRCSDGDAASGGGERP